MYELYKINETIYTHSDSWYTINMKSTTSKIFIINLQIISTGISYDNMPIHDYLIIYILDTVMKALDREGQERDER